MIRYKTKKKKEKKEEKHSSGWLGTGWWLSSKSMRMLRYRYLLMADTVSLIRMPPFQRLFFLSSSRHLDLVDLVTMSVRRSCVKWIRSLSAIHHRPYNQVIQTAPRAAIPYGQFSSRGWFGFKKRKSSSWLKLSDDWISELVYQLSEGIRR